MSGTSAADLCNLLILSANLNLMIPLIQGMGSTRHSGEN